MNPCRGWGGGGNRRGNFAFWIKNNTVYVPLNTMWMKMKSGQSNAPAVPKLSVGLHLWYAPQITSFNGADNFDDIGVSVAYRAMSNAEVFAAYRRVQVDYDREGGRTLHSGPLLGLRLFF